MDEIVGVVGVLPPSISVRVKRLQLRRSLSSFQSRSRHRAFKIAAIGDEDARRALDLLDRAVDPGPIELVAGAIDRRRTSRLSSPPMMTSAQRKTPRPRS